MCLHLPLEAGKVDHCGCAWKKHHAFYMISSVPWTNSQTMPAELCATLGTIHVLAAPLLLDVNLALRALLGQDHHELHLDVLVIGLVLPALNQETGHCVVFFSATTKAKLLLTGTSHNRGPGGGSKNNNRNRGRTYLGESAGSLTTP